MSAELFMRFVNDVRSLTPDERNADGAIAITHEAESTNELDDPALHQNTWSRMARHWARQESDTSFYITAQTLLKYMPTSFPKGKKPRILSLGSGPGLYEMFLAWHLKQSKVGEFRMTPTDYAPGMVEECRRLLTVDGLKIGKMPIRKLAGNIHPIVADMCNLPHQCERSNIVICNNALQWVPDWKVALSEFARVIVPGGTLILIVHPHAMCHRAVDEESGNVEKRVLPLVAFDDMLDCLQGHGFNPKNGRLMAAPQGSGQAGASVSRFCFVLRHSPEDTGLPWRQRQMGPDFLRIAHEQRISHRPG